MADVLVLIHGAAAAERAEQLFGGDPDVELVTLGGRTRLLDAVKAVLRSRPSTVYAIDIGDDTAVGVLAARLRGIPVVVDTGDLVYELERSRGARSKLGLAVVAIGERAALAASRLVVVRGTEHAKLLPRKQTIFAPDIPPANAAPVDGAAVRAELGVSGFVAGLVGSLHRAPRLGTVYGWDLVEALRDAPDVTALIVGDGSGRAELEQRARGLGVHERCRFVGAVPPEAVAHWIGAMDVAISTQTNDRVGAVRTTGKLPLYLACGCPVVASHVGEAARLLGPLGWTLRYDGVVDAAYPARLAAELERLAADPDEVSRRRGQALELAEREFDRQHIRARVHAAVESLGRTAA